MLGMSAFIQANNDLQGMWLFHEDKNKTQNENRHGFLIEKKPWRRKISVGTLSGL
jgi:hypothetical protein